MVTKAGVQGYEDSQQALGDAYYYGRGVEQSYQQAIDWYSKAADQGYCTAQYILGYMYEHGQGVEIDKNKAIEFYKTSGALNYDLAISRLKELGLPI